MEFVVTLIVDGSGRRVGGLSAGQYVRIYEADRFHELGKTLQDDGVFADDLLEIRIQQVSERIAS